MRFLTTLVLTLSASISLNSCTTNPATGRSQLDFMSVEQELQLGEEAAPQFLQENGGEIPSPQILAYVREIGGRLAAASERPDLPWEFHVLDSQVINAFALPGGKVFFSRGLLEKMNNEAQVAAVLGHEVGHVTAKHINERMSSAAVLTGVLGALGAAGETSNETWLQVLGAGGQLGGSLYLLKFGRDQESEADRLGIRYMAQNGYNPVGMMQVMQILKDASAGGAGWEILATHPDPAKRYDDAEELIKDKYPTYGDTSKYKLGEERFEQVVIANLRKLPPAKHGAQALLPGPVSPPAKAALAPKAKSTALAKALARMHELGGCACHVAAGPTPLMMREAEDRR